MRSRKLALLYLAVLIVPNVGCSAWSNVRDTFYFYEPLDEAICSFNCNRAAHAAWKSRSERYCGRERFDHFGAGFRAGYHAVAMGGAGCAPPLPPRLYWGWRYQNCEGQQCVAAWFDGYPAGARAAEEDGVANWSRMQTSYAIDAQYAARMPGNKRGVTPLPPGTPFPGEMIEEIPAAAPVAEPGTSIPAPVEAPAPPVGQTETESATVVETSDLRTIGSETSEEESSVLRNFETPAAETLSGVSVPRKQPTVNVEAAPEIEMNASESTELETESNTITASGSVPAAASPSVIAESPSYSLSGEGEPAITSKPTTEPVSAKRSLPPIIKSKPKKALPPIVRPVDEQGRLTQATKPTASKQVSYESEAEEETPVLRRIGKSNP